VAVRLREPRRLRHGALTLLYDPVPGPLTAIALVVRAGSRCDGVHPGIAHMAEHMLFQGSEHVGTHDHFRLLQQVGGVANGSHTLTAVARDAAGNQTAASVTVNAKCIGPPA